jgi:molybdopterin-synthase adenylyltransferase
VGKFIVARSQLPIDRYHRQVLLPQIGRIGQDRLGAACVLVVGCGALGGMIAEQLVRAGVGTVRIADRDLVELTNLQRQVLFDESDAREQTPKAVAAARKLRQINSQVTIEAMVVDVHAGNAERFAGLENGLKPVNLILDGTDNAETRYLLNDVAVKHGIPWVYGGCVGTEGRCMAMHPPHTACLRCLFPQPPAAGELPTCDTAGVLGPAATVVASLQTTAGLKMLLENPADEQLISVDLWSGRFKSVSTSSAKRPDCPTCGHGHFDFLDSTSGGASTSLCGRNAVQIRPASAATVDLQMLSEKLSSAGQVHRNQYLLRCELHDPRNLKLTVFADGRAIVDGTADPERAKSIYARFVGN